MAYTVRYHKGRKMTTPQELALSFEIDMKKSERKVTNPTKSLVMFVLEESGFGGVWEMRDPRQIKKKGRERFKAIRIESRSGRLGIRVWCKPRGNDTCFEYSLVPPLEVDIQSAFSVLTRVSGVTLKIKESPTLPGAVMGRLMGVPASLSSWKPEAFVPAVESEVVEVAEADVQSIHEESQVHPEFPSLIIDRQQSISSPESIDKALVAIGFVATDGHVEVLDALDSLKLHLGLKAQGATSVLKSLASSMKDLGGYIKRVKEVPAKNGSGVGRIGYKITEKGEERLEEIRLSYGPEVEARLGSGWKSKTDHPRIAPLDAPCDRLSVVSAEVARSVMPDAIARIKSLVASYDEADRQASEYSGVIGVVDEDILKLGAEIERLCRSEKTLGAQMDKLQKEIDEIRAKKQKHERELSEKRAERDDWEKMRSPHHIEKIRIGSLLSELGDKK